MTVMFVCTGNTCRSPMAEGIAKKYISDEKIENIEVKSGGLAASDGNNAAELAVMVMSENGIDISTHQSTGITHRILSSVDYFVPMTEEHKGVLLAAGVERSKIIKFPRGVADPYGGDEYDYRRCRDQLVNFIPDVINKIINK